MKQAPPKHRQVLRKERWQTARGRKIVLIYINVNCVLTENQTSLWNECSFVNEIFSLDFCVSKVRLLRVEGMFRNVFNKKKKRLQFSI